MKANKLFAGVLAALALVACNPNNPTEEVTGITLDQPQVEVEVGQTVTLVATLQPEGVKADITWESSKPEFATVDQNGVVTGVAEGTSYVAAKCGGVSAFCLVTVKPEQKPDEPKELHPSLKGSNYYIFQMDDITLAKIQDKVVADLRVDDQTRFLYIWDEAYITMEAGTTSGLNFYGEGEGWISMQVLNNVTWSGWGLNVQDLEAINKLQAIMAEPDKYYFHMGFKSTTKVAHLFALDGTSGQGRFAIGASFNDNGNVTPMVADYNPDGSWNEIEVPMKSLIDQGLVYGEATKALNLLWGLHGSIAGTNVQLDAIFIYKK